MAKRKVGRPKAIESPEKMLEYFKKYCVDTKNDPILKTDFKGKDAEKVHYDLEKPLTWIGFDVWLFKNDIVAHCEDYRQNKDDRYKEFAGVIRTIGQVIETKSEVTIKETKIGFD